MNNQYLKSYVSEKEATCGLRNSIRVMRSDHWGMTSMPQETLCLRTLALPRTRKSEPLMDGQVTAGALVCANPKVLAGDCLSK
jgi:hypothetical protein